MKDGLLKVSSKRILFSTAMQEQLSTMVVPLISQREILLSREARKSMSKSSMMVL